MSMPLELGDWLMRDGTRRGLVYWPDTGGLVLGDVDVIAVCDDEDDLRRRLEDWPSHCGLRDGLGWIATQLEGCR